MCYLIAKNIDDVGCVALRTTHGKHLSEFKRLIEQKVGYEKIQLVTISRPSAYGEYEPYHFVDSKEEFVYAVEKMYRYNLVMELENFLQFFVHFLFTNSPQIE